jgi:hypothetical protein
MKKQVIEFEISLFREKVFVCISSSEELKEFFSETELTGCDFSNSGLSFGATHNDGKYRRVIWLRERVMSTFVHEAYHITKYILDYAGVECHETGAYLMEFIYSETIRNLK